MYLSDSPGSLCVHGGVWPPSEGKLPRKFILKSLQVFRRVERLHINALEITTIKQFGFINFSCTTIVNVDGTISSNCYKVGVNLFQDSRVTI